MAEVELNANNKGTGKNYKMDENSTHFAVHVSPSIFRFVLTIPLHPAPIQKYSRMYILKYPMLMVKHAPPFCQFFLVLFQPNLIIYISAELSFLDSS